jgi:formamidopyrimidine-DNA glycosylase
LIFRDPRRFGGVRTYPSFAELHKARWSDLGPDATESPRALADRLLEFKSSTRAIKAALLDQAVLAGVGNIYADEALFAAGIKPQRRLRRVKPAEAIKLAESLSAILGRAIEAKGSTLRDYRTASGESGGFQNQHQVYGRARLPCFRCETLLRSALVGQRTTVWCPSCQR